MFPIRCHVPELVLFLKRELITFRKSSLEIKVPRFQLKTKYTFQKRRYDNDQTYGKLM